MNHERTTYVRAPKNLTQYRPHAYVPHQIKYRISYAVGFFLVIADMTFLTVFRRQPLMIKMYIRRHEESNLRRAPATSRKLQKPRRAFRTLDTGNNPTHIEMKLLSAFRLKSSVKKKGESPSIVTSKSPEANSVARRGPLFPLGSCLLLRESLRRTPTPKNPEKYIVQTRFPQTNPLW